MGVSAALGIEGYKQFQLPPRYIPHCWKKECKIMQQIPNWKHQFVHIKCTHKGTVVHSTTELLKCLWGFCGVPAWSGSPMGSGSAGGTQGVCRSKQGRPAFTRGAEHLYYLHSTQCFLLSVYSSFSCIKGAVLKNTLFFTISWGFFKTIF